MTVALAYPNRREVAMASLGYQIVLRRLNEVPGVLALRTFLPEPPAGRQRALLTFDHPREVARCDWLAFSVSYENDYQNILAILAAAGIPLEAERREEHHPLVVIGGIAPSLNPEPLADFADLFVIGEAEEVLAPLAESYQELRQGGADRLEILRALAGIAGVYVPRFYRVAYHPSGVLKSHAPREAGVPAKVKRLWVADLDAFRADSDIGAQEGEFRDMILVEIGRGCGRGCRFCAAGFFYRPVRYRKVETLTGTIDRRLAESKRFGLLGASVFDHPGIGAVARHLGERGCSFSVSSLRADALQATSLAAMAAGGLKTVTIAPETGTEALRRAMGKRMSDEEILKAVLMIAEAGIPNVKLYFMVGLPGETRGDVEAIVDLVGRIRHQILTVARGRGVMGSIIVSVSCYVPKAWTPFQWHPMADLDSLRGTERTLAQALGKIPNVRLTHDLPRWSFIQGLLSRGDRRLGALLRQVHDSGGDWKTAIRQSPINPEFYVYRPRELQEVLPWDFIDTGIPKSLLWKEYMAGLGGE